MTSTCHIHHPNWLTSVLHFGTADFISDPHPTLGSKVRLRLLAPAEAPIRQIILRTIPNGEQFFTGMQPGELDHGLREYSAELQVSEKRMLYRFGIQTRETVWWMNALGISQAIPLEIFDFKLLANTPEINWLSQSVFYQIFPDRFANGDPGNDPQDEALPYGNAVRRTFPWGEAAPQEKGVIPFYGGDLKGIQDHLNYLIDLGINAIYLNPIFTAYTNHRYDVIDYKHVDPTLGGDAALLSLSQALKAHQMRYVLDIVPNHSGIGHPWFRSALQDAASPTAGYFFFDEDHQKYVSWMGFGSLPKLNYASEALRNEMYAGESAVFRHWLRPPYQADGWRVDVANMLGRQDEQQIGPEVMAGIRQAVKETNPQAYLFGENFYEASSQLQGNGWDGVMNYSGFSDPLMNWLRPFRTGAIGWKGALAAENRWETDSLVFSWQTQLASIPWSLALQQLNLLGSHDTTRLLTELEGQKVLQRLAAVVQFTFPGVPCIYYGDEIGLKNQPGFESRACFPWDTANWDVELRAFYQRLISLRKTEQVLAYGAFQMLYWDDSLILFQRLWKNRHILVTANRNLQEVPGRILTLPEAQFGEKARFVGLFSEKSMETIGNELALPSLPIGGEIWLQQ